MGKNSKIICTVVPNGVRTKSDKKRYADFSVFLSPRLPDSGKLKDYYEISNWFKFLNFFRNNNGLRVCIAEATYVEATGYSFNDSKSYCELPIHFDTRYLDVLTKQDKYMANAEFLSTCIFKENTPVKGWVLDEGIYKPETVFLYGENSSGQAASARIPGGAFPTATQDIHNNVMSEEEIIFRNKENQEFHRKLSILADYPHLLRAMGWILDFSILLEKTGDADPAKILASPNRLIKLSGLHSIPDTGDASDWKNFVNEIDFKTPWTYYYFNNATDTFEFSYTEKLEKCYYQVTNRYIHQAQNRAYQISAYQYNRFDSFSNIKNRLDLLKNDLSIKDYTALGEYFKPENNKRVSEGIAIRIEPGVDCSPKETAHRHQPGETTISGDSLLVNGIDNLTANINDYIIFGHNLDNGYVIEVKDNENTAAVFKSLCKRTADYKVDISKNIDKQRFDSLAKGFSDEGWISEVAVAGKSGKFYVREEICRWNNWSLICPQLGKYVQDEEVKQGFWEYNDLELTNIRPQTGSLVPLRFGKSYTFRIRMIDICGNGTDTYADNDGTSFSNQSPDSSNYHVGPVTYKRMEPIGKVEFFFCEKAYQRLRQRNSKEDTFIINDRYRGEKEDVLAIRSEGGDKVDNLLQWFKSRIKDNRTRQFTDESSERSFCPARVSIHFAEVHGACDAKLNSKDVYEKAGYYHSSGVPEYFEPGQKLPFITDPVVKKVKFTLRVLGKFDIANPQWTAGCIPIGTPLSIDYPDWNPTCYGYGIEVPELVTYAEFEDKYLTSEFKSIILECEDKKLNSIETVDNTVYVNLKPGTIGHVYVSVCADGVKPEYTKRDIFYDVPGSINDEFSLLKKLTVVHAVKKPIAYCQDDTVVLALRDRLPFSKTTNPGSGYSEFNGDHNIDVLFQLPGSKISFPFSTASEIVLKMTYTEIIVDRNNEEGIVKVEKTKTKSFNNLCQKGTSQSGIYEQDISVDDVLMPLRCTSDRIQEFMTEKSLQDNRWLAHSFGDTKYRYVTYTLEGVSRFKSFFTDEKPEDFVFSRVIGNAHHVLNSKKMKAPAIHSIVPILAWDMSKPHTVTRTNQKFRIYFSDDWYESGVDEKLGVIFFPKECTIPDTLQELTSSYGKDPIRKDESTKGLHEDHFANQICVTVNSDLLNFEPKDDDAIKADRIGRDLKAAIFNVQFDSKKKLFYSDISIVPDQDDLERYMPFLKLAVCRYQEYSIQRENRYDFRFSKVTMVPQVQLMPARTITWHRNDKKKLTVDGSLMEGNEFYLRCVEEAESNIMRLDDPSTAADTWRALNSIYAKLKLTGNSLIIDENFEIPMATDTRKLYLEEYEVYHANNASGQLVDPVSNVSYKSNSETKLIYDPSNDMTRRLVFSCDLSVIE